MKKLLSIVTPVYNEEENAETYYNRIIAVIDKLSDKYDFEIIITDNCSKDKTFEVFSEIAKKDNRIKIYKFSRNFGYQRSIWTGYTKANGDVAIEFDCDLQDPPELLPQFLEKWENGAKIVYGIRKKRKEGVFITFLRKVFYRFINLISEHELPLDAGDFMLIDRCILNHLKDVKDTNLYLRGTIFSYGYKREGIEYDRQERVKGNSKFPLRKMVSLALDGIISQSTLPLKVASYTGFAVAVLTLVLSFYFILAKSVFGFDYPRGFTTTLVVILFSVSLNSIFLGIIGEYIARIYIDIKKRPMSIIEKEFNI
jgi:dolichol-phosphate mannosyltransferase